MFDEFKDLSSAFNAANVRYFIVGGYAVSLHAQPRATKRPRHSNQHRFRKQPSCLHRKIRCAGDGLSAKDFTEPDNFFRMGMPPVMVDIIPKISGVEFESAWPRRDRCSRRQHSRWGAHCTPAARDTWLAVRFFLKVTNRSLS
jgi:hypothetical protein